MTFLLVQTEMPAIHCHVLFIVDFALHTAALVVQVSCIDILQMLFAFTCRKVLPLPLSFDDSVTRIRHTIFGLSFVMDLDLIYELLYLTGSLLLLY